MCSKITREYDWFFLWTYFMSNEAFLFKQIEQILIKPHAHITSFHAIFAREKLNVCDLFIKCLEDIEIIICCCMQQSQ